MDRKKIDELVDKLLMSRFTDSVEEAMIVAPRGSTIDKIEARQQPYHEPDKPISYRDWIKQQPKPNTIGMRKMKKK